MYQDILVMRQNKNNPNLDPLEFILPSFTNMWISDLNAHVSNTY